MSSGGSLGRVAACGFAGLTLQMLADVAQASSDAPREVRLAVTASVAGELSTCGCASGPQGGLARRSARLAEWRDDALPLVLLDAGGYASTDSIVGGLVTDSLLTYMAREGYAAVAVGDEEIQAGLLSGVRRAPSEPRHVSANLLFETDDGLVPVADRFVLVEVVGTTVGVTAVVSPELVGRVESRPPELLVMDPARAARAALEEMRSVGCDLTVLLAHVPEAEAVTLGRDVSDFDVVVVGHWPRVRTTHAVDRGTVFVHPGSRGRYLADVRLELDEPGLSRVAGGTRGIELRDPVDIDVARWVQRSLGAADARRRAVMIRESASPSPAHGYEGAASCAACHQAEYASWKTTPHARAFETLEMAGMDHAEACIRCHVTGFGEAPLGSRGAAADLRGVQCEACHEVPAGHPQAPVGPAVEPGTCRRCHDAVNSPQYEHETYWRRVLHGSR